MRILVAIANHGTKNEGFCRRLIDEYRSMSHDVHVAVLSNTPKDLGPGVEVIVGVPSANPWSLPFAHAPLFLERAGDYDLFIYSEDDTLITERNIDAFVRAASVLPDDEIPGFLRFEQGPDGTRYISTIHSHYHWLPGSVKSCGEFVFARYTNDHAASFLLTRHQLRRAIDAGGFSKGPRQGRYDMLCTAATDPYVEGGLTKLIPISHLEEFSLRHLPDKYLGTIGTEATGAMREIERLLSLEGAAQPIGPLFDGETRLDDATWDKPYYEDERRDLLSLVPESARRVLFVGSGSGATEGALRARGVDVEAVPMDAVVAASLEARGVSILPPDLGSAAVALDGSRFDCVVLSEVLGHVEDPVDWLRRAAGWAAPGGSVVISVANFHHHGLLRRWLRGDPIARRVLSRSASFDELGIHRTTRSQVDDWLRRAGLRRTARGAPSEGRTGELSRRSGGLLDVFLDRRITVAARAARGGA
ncbi:MAG: class I SAM-dependent methyltransferase [Myxococcota bacterium]